MRTSKPLYIEVDRELRRSKEDLKPALHGGLESTFSALTTNHLKPTLTTLMVGSGALESMVIVGI